MIEVKKLKRIYMLGNVEVPALKDVSFKIKKGEFVGIMGPSGSGKSTLLHQIALLDNPTEGEIFIDKTDILQLTDKEKTSFRLYELGYVFQDYALLGELTTMENVYLPLLTMGWNKEDYIKASSDILKKVGLGHRINHLQRELSGGEQQRVAIARALVNKPKIVFADEPCANLDSRASKKILELFKELNKDLKQTIVMVTHEEWHKKYLDRIIYLKDGLLDKNKNKS